MTQIDPVPHHTKQRPDPEFWPAWAPFTGEQQSVYDDMADERSGSPSDSPETVDEQAEILTRRLAESEKSLKRLEEANSRLGYRLDVSEWKLASLRQRRWVRLGAELQAARDRPSKILLLPVRIWRVLKTSAEPLPRPTATDEFWDQDTCDFRSDQSKEVVAPVRDVTALAMLGDELREALMHEVRIVDFKVDRWRSQLKEEAPALLFLDSDSVVSLGEGGLREVLSAVQGVRATSVLWDVNPEAVSVSTRALFDVICGDKALLGDSRWRLVERRGWVQPRIHNPIGGHRRPKDVADVDPAGMKLADAVYRSTTALTQHAKLYKALRAGNEVSDPVIAPIVATATPVIVSQPSTDLGLRAETEESAYYLERSLLRSDVLRARHAHPAMREVLRNRSVASDIDSILGVDKEARWPRIDVMVPTRRRHLVARIFENLGRQTYPSLALYLVAHGVRLNRQEVEEYADQAGVELASMVEVDEDVVLGEVFNIGFGETESSVVAKMDDDDFYGAEYLWDLYTALEFSGAEVTGKWAHFAYLEGFDSLVYRFKDYEHRFTDVVAISTLLMRRDVFDVSRFPEMPWGSGSVFLREVGSAGARVFAADRWNYLYVRTKDGSQNTFPGSDLEILAASDVTCRGLNVHEVIL